MKKSLSEISRSLRKESTFVSCPSFEARSLLLPRKASETGCRLITFGVEPFESVHESSIASITGGERTLVSRFDPISQWTALQPRIGQLSGDVTVDVTGFTRELLGMLIFALLRCANSLSSCSLLYVSATGYAVDKGKELSKGVLGVRTILGYPGRLQVGLPMHLVAMVGFEPERIVEVIDAVEPDILSLSNEKYGTSTGERFAGLSSKNLERVEEMIGSYERRAFTFSANDAVETMRQLDAVASAGALQNLVVAAMNTKLSFVGACLHGLRNPNTRLVYAVPGIYQTEEYSTVETDEAKVEVTTTEILPLLKESLRLRST